MTQTPVSKPPSQGSAKPAGASAASGPPAAAKTKEIAVKKGWSADPVEIDVIADEADELKRHNRLLKLVTAETILIALLAILLILGVPFFQPVYQYFALNPQQQRLPIVALDMPNMTNRAVLSWSTISITEIMTMGFGDYEPHLKAQRFRFTDAGWDSFATAFDKQKIGESFSKHQLVLTTIPSNTPVILGQGENPHHVYQWNVQMPVIMTYATNNNVSSRQKTIINLAIVRVPTSQNPDGIGIQSWRIGS